MGLYDTFYLEITCPLCGVSFWDYAQTKSLFCEMTEFRVGDFISWGDDEIFVYSFCGDCEETLFQGIEIRDGRVERKTITYTEKTLPAHIHFDDMTFFSSVAEQLREHHRRLRAGNPHGSPKPVGC